MEELNKKMVVFVGDSITRHYFMYAANYLREHGVEGVIPDKWTSCQWKQLRFLEKNCAPKRVGRDVSAAYCHFNFGLHSIKLPDKGRDPNCQRALDSDFETYEKELIEEVKLLWSYSIKPLFSNTTPNPKNAGMRNDKDVVILNEIAKKVMDEHGIPHNDLYSFVKSQEDYPRLYMHPRSENNCHFLDHGRKLLGENVAQFVLDNMEDE
jgi:hypothetical protein